ncbi:5-oxoprolinase subunit PxpB [Mucilaginibacter ximonensis]|uniref:5-oxoprolinase subunit PxpB n=1 Tax=Mucilaginibacter ximonensis TaxID=538021 RepID=A0ABW5YGA1_9SPHI
MSDTVSEPVFSIYYLSEQALTLEFGNDITPRLLSSVSAFNHLLQQKPFPGFKTTIPAYATLTVLFDPLIVAKSDLRGKSCFEKVSAYLLGLNSEKLANEETTASRITIPVCYGGEFGSDLQELASLLKMDTAELVKLHSEAVYQVYMIGFVPGFAYLGGMDKRLESPRKTTPRKSVPAGSVGIAGMQTGIYPLQTPGGWQLIGRTPLQLFDVKRAQPSLLKAGDEVVFKPITEAEFSQLITG